MASGSGRKSKAKKELFSEKRPNLDISSDSEAEPHLSGEELNTRFTALTIKKPNEQKATQDNVKETQDGEWLSGHPWINIKPNHDLIMKPTVANSSSYPTSAGWTMNGEVDLAAAFLHLSRFIESEMKGTINSSRQELEKLVSHVIHTDTQMTPNTLFEFSPYVREIVDKIQGNNTPKDQGSYKVEKFKASSIPQSTSVSPRAENYFHFDCEYTLQMYVPDSMLSWFDTQLCERYFCPILAPRVCENSHWIRKSKNKAKRWIFIPSFRRAQIALLNWPQDIVIQESTIRILVVRPSEFDEYVKHCGHLFPVICLPQDEIGAGYARYWIQKIALRLTLKFIWMIDDSIECFYEYHPDKPPPTDSYTKYRRRKFGCVFKRIEEFVKEADDSENPIAAMSPRRFNVHYRLPQPFVCKPPQGAVYLNLRALSTKNIFYRPELKTLEDIIFGYECEKNGLKVFMDNRVHFQDHDSWKNTGASSPSVKIKKT